MRKSTIAAIAAAAVVGFGAVGSASAGVEISGFGDVQYNAADIGNDGYSADGQEGNFRASGEIDLRQVDGGGPEIGIDLDVLDIFNTTPQTDIPSGTNGGLGVDVEQFYVKVPVNDMVSVTAGAWDSIFGYESQDANMRNHPGAGLLWQSVPSVMIGGLVSVAPTDMVNVNVAYINGRSDATGLASENVNDVAASVAVTPMDGLGINLAYLTDNGTTGGTDALWGDSFDIFVTADMVENLSLAAEYLSGDPASGGGALDNGYGVHAAYDAGVVTVAVRYESASYDTTNDVTETSGSVSHQLAQGTVVRLDWTNTDVDNGASSDIATIQLVHDFDHAM